MVWFFVGFFSPSGQVSITVNSYRKPAYKLPVVFSSSQLDTVSI